LKNSDNSRIMEMVEGESRRERRKRVCGERVRWKGCKNKKWKKMMDIS
jgi:hypothetical protein